MAITPNSGYDGPVFYNPNTNRPDFIGSDIWRSMAENNRREYYGNVIGNAGYMGTDNKSRFMQDRFNNFDAGYQAMLFNRPNYDWVSHLRTMATPEALERMWAGASDEERGINRAQYAGGTQWLQRS